MSRPGYKTKSDTMLLRRLINNLRERGSEVGCTVLYCTVLLYCAVLYCTVLYCTVLLQVAGELERKAHNFLTDVQMKRRTIEVSSGQSSGHGGDTPGCPLPAEYK